MIPLERERKPNPQALAEKRPEAGPINASLPPLGVFERYVRIEIFPQGALRRACGHRPHRAARRLQQRSRPEFRGPLAALCDERAAQKRQEGPRLPRLCGAGDGAASLSGHAQQRIFGAWRRRLQISGRYRLERRKGVGRRLRLHQGDGGRRQRRREVPAQLGPGEGRRRAARRLSFRLLVPSAARRDRQFQEHRARRPGRPAAGPRSRGDAGVEELQAHAHARGGSAGFAQDARGARGALRQAPHHLHFGRLLPGDPALRRAFGLSDLGALDQISPGGALRLAQLDLLAISLGRRGAGNTRAMSIRTPSAARRRSGTNGSPRRREAERLYQRRADGIFALLRRRSP